MTRLLVIILFLVNWSLRAGSQPDSSHLIESTVEQQLENLVANAETATEDDSFLLQYEGLQKRPMDINVAEATDLGIFLFLSPMQVQYFLQYRQLLGKLVSIYELQAVPGWNLETIRRILPFIRVGSSESLYEDFKTRLSAGEANMLLRVSQTLQKSAGFKSTDTTPAPYAGSRQRIFFRYRYQYKNLLQYGLLGEKDAGEQFLKGPQKAGFDFYSFHVAIRNVGIIKQFVIGDFTANIGQGLISWQAIAFGKGANVTAIKRQAEILRPYSSAGEFNFYRGAGISLLIKDWQLTVFGALNKRSANVLTDSAANSTGFVSSLQSSGYHRTTAEIADRNQVKDLTYGGNLSFSRDLMKVGFSFITHTLSSTVSGGADPYQAFSVSGKRLLNASADYSYNFKNLHLFGEVATDQQGHPAILQGLLASLDPRVDLSFVYRNIHRAYQSRNASAFTESSAPVNEKGWYTGIEIRPVTGIRLTMYADIFRFPWLRYRVDRPSQGADYLFQLTWKPNKQVELYARFLSWQKAVNESDTEFSFHNTDTRTASNWRINMSFKLSASATFRCRAEWIKTAFSSSQPETGYLHYADFLYKPMMKKYNFGLRLAFFETDSYNTRVYAYENNVLYDFSIPALFGKGYRGYLNVGYDISERLGAWLKIAATIYPGQAVIGSGLDAIGGHMKSDINFQLLYRR